MTEMAIVGAHIKGEAMKAQRLFGVWIKTRRESMGLNPKSLIKKIGYANLNKGLRRLNQWETGVVLPNQRQSRQLRNALRISDAEWEKKQKTIEQAMENLNRLHSASSNGVAYTMKQLATHQHLLRKARENILENSNWRHIPLQGLHAGMAYIGGTAISLGGLLNAWSMGLFQGHHPAGHFFALKGGGSPLSGRQEFIGFVEGEKRLCRHRQLFKPLAANLGPALQEFKRHRPTDTPISLDKLLSTFGVSIKPVNIYRQARLWAQFDHNASQLRFSNDPAEIYFSDMRTKKETKGWFSEQKNGDKHWVYPSLMTQRVLGKWHGQNHQVTFSEQAHWTLAIGGALDHEGDAAFWNDAPLPRAVSIWLAYRLAKECENILPFQALSQ